METYKLNADFILADFELVLINNGILKNFYFINLVIFYKIILINGL